LLIIASTSPSTVRFPNRTDKERLSHSVVDGTNSQTSGTASEHSCPSRHVSLAKGVRGAYAGVMKTLVSKSALCVYFLSALPIAHGAQPMAISMTADRWQVKENAEFLRQLGFYHGLMRLNSGNAVLKDLSFGDGTIEFDVNTIGRGAPGIAFRQQDEKTF